MIKVEVIKWLLVTKLINFRDFSTRCFKPDFDNLLGFRFLFSRQVLCQWDPVFI